MVFYISQVIGLQHFERNKCQKPCRAYVTISNEAFAILTLENKWEQWIIMAKANTWTTSPVPTKRTLTRDWTATAAKKSHLVEHTTGQPQARQYRGWSAQGINC